MMTTYRIDRRKALKLMGAVSLVAVPGARVSAQTLDKVSYQTNWRAQAEAMRQTSALSRGRMTSSACLFSRWGFSTGENQKKSRLCMRRDGSSS